MGGHKLDKFIGRIHSVLISVLIQGDNDMAGGQVGGGILAHLRNRGGSQMCIRDSNKVISLTPTLPAKCFSVLPSSGELIVIERYKPGYELSAMAHFKGKTPQQTADALNANMGVTRAQAAAMLAGSMFGWTVPAADPKNYNAQGRPIKPRHQDGGNAR